MSQQPTYTDLGIHERINLKELARAWTDITIDRFREKELDQKVYSQRDWKTKKTRIRTGMSRRLRTNWTGNFIENDQGGGRILMSFMLYGRFVDMGVGKYIDSAEAKYRRDRKNGERLKRRAKRWYSRRKGFETHRLRELLAKYYINISLDSLEAMLTNSITVTV